ncbi:MAG: FAD-binding oxidoreductase [Smithellaceae bacterium]|jgi:D-lactate dehydrogenase (cytochrome)|nr:FAD-binding oxidoreductase [Smithellaceae bacterium]MDD3258396.1 FAD-binding oxidoreductase [Smithellaceae bacterium]MDD3849936.1 FAD-binding oxidoreductase [Smithellaceae bacterium]HOG13161.1 FAD-binding oxidoreductase [Smithellaceae bacterium]HPL09292.1 FAD-binding oxidoreductase [Smithellaceae bacterium]
MTTEADLSELKAILDERRVSAGQSVRHLHSRDESFHSPSLPEVVVWPRSTEEVSRLVRWACRKKVPVTAWGAGTSLEGNPIPVRGGMVMDFSEMNRVLALLAEDFQADVQPGVVYKELNRQLAREGLFFPPDPGAAATIGGMIGNNASGIRSVRYGATKDYVMRLTVVLPGGDVIHAGNRARKSSSGYNLAALFTGSEGTLGIITEATLKLAGLPVNFMAVRATFPAVRRATDTVYAIMRAGLSPVAMEFLDANVVHALNADRGLTLEENPTLLMEFSGYSEQGLSEEMSFVEEICFAKGALSLDRGIGAEERARLWEIRHQTYESVKRCHIGLSPLIMDVAVPLSRYGEMVEFSKQEVRDLTAYLFGHAGDGNIHVHVMDNPQDPKRWARVEEASRSIVMKALEFEGTCTGEHGVGIGKSRFMEREHGASLILMKRLKGLLDPENLLNPGKFFL